MRTLYTAILLLACQSLYGIAPIVLENISHVPSKDFSFDVRLTRPYQEPDLFIARGLKMTGDCLIMNLEQLHGQPVGGPYQIEGYYSDEQGQQNSFRLPYAQRGQGWQIITEHYPQQNSQGESIKRVRFNRGTMRSRCPLAQRVGPNPYQYVR
ncbi:MAG: hypothetical protein WD068_01635 [Candidatus Babeliales bacterium]